jgi:polysaccharide deacetylase family protein (PEP-CTERM system associated)
MTIRKCRRSYNLSFMPDPVLTLLKTPGRAPRVLTVDAEDWFHVCGDDYYSDARRWDRFAPRVETTLASVFELLARGGHRATVFFLGWIAARYPDLVREAVRRGHEVGLHGDLHRRVDGMSREEFRDDLARSRDKVERASGSTARAYRAAEWSIRHAAEPALEELVRAGFACDASIVSVPPLGRAENPVGPFRVEFATGALVEVPPLTGRGFGRRIPVGGGWAFRMLRPSRIRAAENAFRERGHPAVFTFHPWEFDPEHPPMESLAPLVKLVHFYNLRSLPRRFEAWLGQDRAVTLSEAAAALGPA